MDLLGFLGLRRAAPPPARIEPAPSASATFDLTQMSPQEVREFLRMGGGFEAGSGVVVNETSAMKVAAAWRCINILAGAIGTLPLDLVRRVGEGERRPAEGHPLRRVLTVRPNAWQTPGEFRRMMQAHVELRGNAFALIDRLGGQVNALIPIHPDRVDVEQENDLSLTYHATTKDGRRRRIEPREIFHLRGLSLDGYRGLSPLSHMRETLGLSLAAEQAVASLMKNGQIVGGVLKHPGTLSPEAFERLAASLAERRTGGASAGKTMILEEGMDYGPVAMTAQDLQFLQQRDFQRYDVAMFFGVPPHMIGATEKTTSWGSGIEAQGIGFVTYTLSERIKMWEEAIKRDLIDPREQETLDARIYTQGLMRGDVAARSEFYVRMRQWGVLSADEIRALEDMNKRPDGRGGEYAEPPNTAGGRNGGTGDEPSQTAET